MLSNKVFFGALLLVLVAGIIFITTYSPDSAEPADASGSIGAPAAASDDSLPRADVAPTSASVGLDIGDRAPGWSLQDPQGRTHSLNDYLGQVVVMDFWATWCGPCKMVMPDLQKLHEQYEPRGVRVLGMNGSERGNPAKFMSDNDYTYGLLLKSEQVMSKYGVQGIPMIYVIGVDGSILYKHVGYLPDMKDKLAQVIDPHLEKHGL